MTAATHLRLYTYWRSTAAYRVRIALNLKGLEHELLPVHLVRDGGEQHRAAFRKVNPQGLVPALEHGDVVLQQSLAIVEYLEDIAPAPRLLPASAAGKGRVRGLAQLIACDVHPLNNLRVLKYLTGTLGVDEDAKLAWYRHWVSVAFTALEAMLAESAATGRFCHGDVPGLADLCLVPQLYNAQRFECDLADYPTIERIAAGCLALPEFDEARPENQPDAPPGGL